MRYNKQSDEDEYNQRLLQIEQQKQQKKQSCKKIIQIVISIGMFAFQLYCYIASFIHGNQLNDFKKVQYMDSDDCKMNACYYYPRNDDYIIDIEKDNCYIQKQSDQFFLEIDLTFNNGAIFMYVGLIGWSLFFKLFLWVHKATYEQVNIAEYYLNVTVFQYQNIDSTGNCLQIESTTMYDAALYAGWLGMGILSGCIAWSFISLLLNCTCCFIFLFLVGFVFGCMAFNAAAAMIVASPPVVLGIAIPFKIFMVYYFAKGFKQVYDIWTMKKPENK